MRRAFVIGCNCLCNCSPGKVGSSQTQRQLCSSKAQYSCPANNDHSSFSFSPSLTPDVSLCSLYLSISRVSLSKPTSSSSTGFFCFSSISILPSWFFSAFYLLPLTFFLTFFISFTSSPESSGPVSRGSTSEGQAGS